MLRAMMADGKTPVFAFRVPRGAPGPFLCPECGQKVLFKAGPKKVKHFAHWLDATSCAYGAGESEEHMQAKMELYEALQAVADVEDVQMEQSHEEVRSDVSFVYHGQTVALEVQISSISRKLLTQRTEAYARQHIAVLWMVPCYTELEDERYSPRDYERYLHGLYYGKVYYWDGGLQLQPITFEDYMLAADRYRDERRSRRYKTPRWLEPVFLLDLTSVWRQPWGDYPRAKLWCQPSRARGYSPGPLGRRPGETGDQRR